jgi:hypothetical protein
MPSPLLQLRIPQDLADWLEDKYPSRGEVAEYVRQLLTAEQMKEAVAPLVPTSVRFDSSIEKVGPATVEDWKAFQDDALTPEESEILAKAWSHNEFDAHKAKPKARRKKRVEPEESIDLMVALKSSIDAKKAQLPARCNRGACTGTINPVSGRCLHCNQTPLKESK